MRRAGTRCLYQLSRVGNGEKTSPRGPVCVGTASRTEYPAKEGKARQVSKRRAGRTRGEKRES